MIEATATVKCPWCLKETNIVLWDKTTLEECTTKEMKQNYTSIRVENSWDASKELAYKCPNPKCKRWSRSNTLKLLNSKYSLGGDSLFEVNK